MMKHICKPSGIQMLFWEAAKRMLRHPNISIDNMNVSAVGSLPTNQDNRTTGIELGREASKAITTIYGIFAICLDFIRCNEISAPHADNPVEREYVPFFLLRRT